MRLVKWLLTASLLAGGVLLLFAVAGGSSEVPASFSILPGNPVAGRSVLFRDTSGVFAGAVEWHWDFGDGEVSSMPSPLHAYRFPGVYTVTLTVLTPGGSRVQKQSVEISAANTLTLLSRRFEVTLSAVDQRTGRTGEGLAIPQNDLFGIFAIPDLTSNPDNPEMFVKMLDGRVLNNFFWFFYNGLTDLDVTLTVRDMQTGAIKTYRKEPGSACGGFDTAAFSGSSMTATPTPPGPTPTRTPTPGSGTTIQNVAVSRFRYDPGTSADIPVTAGVPTTLVFESSDVKHGFSGIPELGISGSANISPGGDGGGYGEPGTPPSIYSVTFTAPSSARGRTFSFSCTASPPCGTTAQHEGMRGTLRVN